MKEKKGFSMIQQVAIVFASGVLIAGLVTFLMQRVTSGANVTKQIESMAKEISENVTVSITEYPAYRWMIRYWYENADKMDIEYDIDYSSRTETEEKSRLLSRHNPDLQLKYADEREIEALSEEDQKLYAEVTYSWLITRLNQIKRSYDLSYLFIVLTTRPYDNQFFLLSASEPDSVRGTEYEQVYPLGVKVSVSKSQQEAMRDTRKYSGHLTEAGKYVDYYSYLDTVEGQDVLIGMTYDQSTLQDSVRAQAALGTGFAMFSQFILSAICLFLILKLIVWPLKTVQHYIRHYKDTKDGETVRRDLAQFRSTNEIGQLSEDVSELTQEIDDYLERIQNITAEKERIETELALAARIQTSMLPNVFPAFPDYEEFDIYATMYPAKEVGGDFYDFFLIDEDHLGMVIADVSGKGVPAALFMMASKIILANNAKMGKSPAQILADANASITSNNREEMFVTVWLGILDLTTGKLTAANAGHEFPAIQVGSGQFTLFRDKHGLVIGAMTGVRYHEYEIQMSPGDKIFLYTDGVTEATNAEKDLFGTRRMLDALNKDPETSVSRLLDHVKSAIEDFAGDVEQFDDITMMCMEYKKPKAPKEI